MYLPIQLQPTLSGMCYPIPINTVRYELIVKKSRFIAITSPCNDRQQLQSILTDTASEFPDARHICHACIMGKPDRGSVSSNDDGEPSGTAGKPILNALLHSGAGDIATVVVRYFGGIKLGAGGLVRAYSNATAGCLKLITTTRVESTRMLSFSVDFGAENQLRQILKNAGATNVSIDYRDLLIFSCTLPEQQVDTTVSQLLNATRGQIMIKQNPGP